MWTVVEHGTHKNCLIQFTLSVTTLSNAPRMPLWNAAAMSGWRGGHVTPLLSGPAGVHVHGGTDPSTIGLESMTLTRGINDSHPWNQ